MKNKKSPFPLRTIVHVALLIALEVVLTRFCSINTTIVRIGFGFVPVAVCAMMYGPVWAGCAGALADIAGALLFPTGPFFPGFTVSAALTGVVFGLFLVKKKESDAYLVYAVLVNCVGISLLLSTYWLSVLTGTAYLNILPARVVQNLIMIPVQFLTLRLLRKGVILYLRRTA